MSTPYGELAILKQHELLREAAQRHRDRTDKERTDVRRRDRKLGIRRLLHR